MVQGEIVEVGSHEELMRGGTGSTPVCGRCSPIRRGRRHERARRASGRAAAAAPPRRARPTRSPGRDREFLPAALEILETPPPPAADRPDGDDLRLSLSSP